MNNLTLIAAVAKNNVIGNAGKIPWNIPDEMALFKTITMGNPVMMGRKTFESIGHALPGREMFVLSRAVPLLAAVPPLTPPSKGGEITFCASIQDALDKTKNKRTVFVMGGSEVYAQMMPLADEMLISHLHKAYEGDAWFPEIDSSIWSIVEQQEFPEFIHIKYTRT